MGHVLVEAASGNCTKTLSDVRSEAGYADSFVIPVHERSCMPTGLLLLLLVEGGDATRLNTSIIDYIYI